MKQRYPANHCSISYSLIPCKQFTKNFLTNKRSKHLKLLVTISLLLLFIKSFFLRDGFSFPNELYEVKPLKDLKFEKYDYLIDGEQYANDSTNGEGGVWKTWPECNCGPPVKGVECLASTLPRSEADIKHGEGGACSWRAWQDSSASVIAVSAYGVPYNYLETLDHLVKSVGDHYPDWSLWIYTRHANPKEICKYLKSHPNAFFCDTRNIPALGDLKRTSPFAWKISALGDNRINRVLMKDIDYSPLDREAAAVSDWLSSGETYHVTRDHPQQLEAIVMNQWGAQWNKSEAINMRAIRNVIMEKSKSFMKRTQSNDVLLTHLWPEMLASESLLIHDSFHCNKNRRGIVRHWPTKRFGNSYVGMTSPNASKPLPDCPVECRPPLHMDWNKC